MLKRFRHNLQRKVRQKSTGYDTKENGGSYEHGTSMLNTRLDELVRCVVLCVVERRTLQKYRQNVSSDTYSKMVETVTRKLTDSIREFLQYCS